MTHAVIAPGSRSAPLALAIADHPSIEHHVVLDERSASFRTLGMAKATGRPALVVCTSGTAAAELTAAVHEAHHWRVPLLVVTADRPPELRSTGANQTIDQVKLFGDAVRWFFDLGVPEGAIDASPDAYWRSVACQAVARALGSPPGPVHLNVPLREPLVATDEAPLDLDLGGRADGRPWVEVTAGPRGADDETVDALSRMVTGRRGVVVVGSTPGPVAGAAALARALGWPLL
ncbi:MAG: 2-succinyl-5-enolpyruvyl-6-hydroxy-3-cyclohexene-1-carboxylic-acid synthase, partial [Acidimicrobiia bacterium]